MSLGIQELRSQRAEIPSRQAEADRPLIILVDDDENLCEALQDLLLSAGLDTIRFASTRALLDAELPDRPGCLVADVRMPGGSGLQLQARLAEGGNAKPIVFLTGCGDVPMSVQAMKAGAVDFLTKPIRPQVLLDAIAVGIARDIQQRAHARIVKVYVERFALLTARERQVLQEIAAGQQNKQIAFHLGVSEITVKLHRTNLKRKMRATSVTELLRAWQAVPAEVRARDA